MQATECPLKCSCLQWEKIQFLGKICHRLPSLRLSFLYHGGSGAQRIRDATQITAACCEPRWRGRQKSEEEGLAGGSWGAVGVSRNSRGGPGNDPHSEWWFLILCSVTKHGLLAAKKSIFLDSVSVSPTSSLNLGDDQSNFRQYVARAYYVFVAFSCSGHYKINRVQAETKLQNGACALPVSLVISIR